MSYSCFDLTIEDLMPANEVKTIELVNQVFPVQETVLT